MSEPYWTPLSPAPVDYEGAYNPATQYAPGDVITYQGVTYLCVNPALGQTPPTPGAAGGIGTSLPAGPVDGQEFILVDSLTAPTYQWLFRYLAAKATNKWLFIGGSRREAEVATPEVCNSTSYVTIATAGPSVVVPVAGDYFVENGCRVSDFGGFAYGYMSYDIGATPATDADAVQTNQAQGGVLPFTAAKLKRKSLGAITLTAKYKVSGLSCNFAERYLAITPIAVGG